MSSATSDQFATGRDGLDGGPVMRFTPLEWRAILRDPSFLDDPDNDYHTPRKLFGLAVAIVPDHTFG